MLFYNNTTHNFKKRHFFLNEGTSQPSPQPQTFIPIYQKKTHRNVEKCLTFTYVFAASFFFLIVFCFHLFLSGFNGQLQPL